MNGLKLCKGIESDSKVFSEKISDYDELKSLMKKSFLDNGFVVAYLHYKVLIGRVTQGIPEFYQREIFDPKHLLKLRVFNENKELFIWSRGEYIFQGRLRIDGHGPTVDIVEAEQVLWGTRHENLEEGWTRIFEERGTEINLPIDVKVTSKSRVKIKTRNYIGHNETGQAGYVDCRFVEFVEGRDY